MPDANLRQVRAILAAEIVKTLDSEGLTVRDAEARTGIAAADFSRIRQVKLDRFTIDRLMRILDRRQDVMRIGSRDSLKAYQELLDKHFPENRQDIAGIIREIGRIMGYMDVLYGIDNPLFLDLKSHPETVLRTILPWALKYLLTAPKVAKLDKPVDEHLSGFTTNRALLDIIVQHFFQKTPAFFALSYFSLYLDYRYPRGGTAKLPEAVRDFILAHGGEIRTATEIVNSGGIARSVAVDIADGRSVDVAMAELLEEHATIPLLVNNAGILLATAHWLKKRKNSSPSWMENKISSVHRSNERKWERKHPSVNCEGYN